jgi:hypothetical protein
MRKCIYFFTAVLILYLSSCKKESAADRANEETPSGTILAQGSFVSNVHPSSGTVKVVQGASGKISLVFENFRTDNGPDLRIWLASNTNADNYVEIGPLTAVSGNFSYEMDSSVSYAVNNTVLIWCEDFSVLFGHAVLR